jgi:hypothetical protein
MSQQNALPPSRVTSLPGDSGGPLLSNPKSSLALILAAVAATIGGDGGAYPSERRWAGEESLGRGSRGLVGIGRGPWTMQLFLAGA